MVNQEATNVTQSVLPQTLPAARKYRHLAFCLLPQMLFVLLGLGLFWGRGYWLLMPTVFLLVVVPLLDLLTGWQDTEHFSLETFSPAEISLLHWNTRLYALLYIGSWHGVAMSLYLFSAIEIVLPGP